MHQYNDISRMAMFNRLKKNSGFPQQHTKKDAFLNAVKNGSHEGLSTRQLADMCGESLYCARHWLLILERERLITRRQVGRDVIWHAAEP